MPDFVIKTQFRGIDKLTPSLKKIGIQVDKTGRRMDRSFKRATRSAEVFRGVLKGVIVAGVMRRAAMGASMAIRGLSEEFVEFDKNITKAVTRLPGGLDRSSEAFKRFGDVARKEAARTEFTAGEAALGVEQLALAGFKVDQVIGTLPGVLNLATNAEVELATAATMATKTLGAFGLKVDDTAQLQTNLTRVNDVFSKTVSSASITMEQLFEVMKFGGPSAKAAGQQIETFSALAGVLADSAIDASVAGTSLRSMFINLAAPVPKARKLIKKLGIRVKDSNGDFLNMITIMDSVGKATKDMSQTQRLATLNVIFGKRAVNAANVMLEKGTDELLKYEEALIHSGGASKRMSKIIRTSIEGRMKRLKSALVEVGFKFIEAFNKNAGSSIEAAIKAVSEFDVKPVVKALKDMIHFAKQVWNALQPIIQNLPTFIGLWLGLKVGMKAVAALEMAGFLIELTAAIGGGTLAMKGLNAQMLRTVALTAPIIGVFAALGATIAIVATDFPVVVHGWEEGIARMILSITELGLVVAKQVRGIMTHLSPLANFLGLDNFAFEFADDVVKSLEQSVKSQKIIIADIEAESVDAEIKRGVAGIRGFVPPAETNQRRQDALRTQLGAAGFNPFLRGIGGGRGLDAARTSPTAPNRSQVEAQRVLFEAQLNFKNAPEGMTVDSKSGRGAPKIRTSGLGEQ